MGPKEAGEPGEVGLASYERLQAGVGGAVQRLLRLQKILELGVGGKSPRGAQEVASLGGVPTFVQMNARAVERDALGQRFDVPQVDGKFHRGFKADAERARQSNRLVIAVWSEVAIDGLVVCGNAALAVFVVSGKAEQNTHELDTVVDAGTHVLRPGGDGRPQ